MSGLPSGGHSEAVWRLSKQSAVAKARFEEYCLLTAALDEPAPVALEEFLEHATRLTELLDAHDRMLREALETSDAVALAHRRILESSADSQTELERATSDLANAQDHHVLALALDEAAQRIARDGREVLRRAEALLR